MKVLITGYAGGLGGHFLKKCHEHLHETWGVDSRSPARPGPHHLVHARILEKSEISRWFHEKGQELDAVVHLGAKIVGDPETLYQNNVLGTLGLLEAARLGSPKLKFIHMGSSAQYGQTEKIIREDCGFAPLTHYGISKVASEEVARISGLNVIRARAFNLVGPGIHENLFFSRVARQLVDIELGNQKPELDLGTLESVRDFVDIRDVAHALHLLMEKGQTGEAYNICSGVGVKLSQAVRMMLELTPFGSKIEIKTQPRRSDDVAAQVGDPSKLGAQTGWKPKWSLKQSLADLLEKTRRHSRSQAQI